MLHVIHFVIAGVPNPGQGVQPPGGDKVNTLLSWVAWVVTALCVGGVLWAGGKMAVSHTRGYGGGGEHAASLGWVLAGCIVAGAASSIAAALL